MLLADDHTMFREGMTGLLTSYGGLEVVGETQGITITSRYEDRQGESYETEWTINPLLLEGSGYSEYKGYEDEVQSLEDQARILENIKEANRSR